MNKDCEQISVRELRCDDLREVVQIHTGAFPEFFLTTMGSSFLTELYGGYVRHPSGIALVAEKQGDVLGFIVGTIAPRGFFKSLLIDRWFVFTLLCFGAVIRRPRIISRLARGAFYRGGGEAHPVGFALISSIAVRPGKQGVGCGGALMKAWVGAAQAAGATGCYLVTDADDNEGANRFYRKAGFVSGGSYVTRENRVMNQYLRKFIATK